MSDPTAVSRYISNQMKISRAEKYKNQPTWREQGNETKLEQETKTKKQCVNTEVLSKIKTTEAPNGKTLAPKKAPMNHYFKATIDNLQSQMTDSSPTHKMGLLVKKQPARKKIHHVDISSVPDQPEGKCESTRIGLPPWDTAFKV